MTTEVELVDAIAAALDDDAPRLVYADWLAERGDPRGEFMQLQLARAAMSDDDDRAKPTDKRIAALLDEHRDRWLGKLAALRKYRIEYGFARGMIGSVRASALTLAKNASQIVAAAPLLAQVTIAIDRTSRDVSALAGTELIARVRVLALASAQAVRVTGWERIALPELRSLSYSTLALGPEELEVLGRAPKLASLHFHHCRFNKGAVEPFARASNQLRVLDLTAAHLGARLAEIARDWCELVELHLAGNELGSAGLARLLPALGRVEQLDLRGNELVIADLPGLLAAIPKIRVLELGGNLLGDEGAAMIARSAIAPQLSRLSLGLGGVTAHGARILADSPGLANLRSLVLTGKRFDPQTEAILVGSPHLAKARIYGGDRFLARP